MQREVSAIPVPDAANELADDILCELRKNGMTVSDRKYLGYYCPCEPEGSDLGRRRNTP